MKNRTRQRENRRLKHQKPWLNPEGYHDPTPYEALRNIKRQEDKKTQYPKATT